MTGRPVLSSVDELLAEATSREPFFASDGKSGSAFERVVIGDESLIVKHIHIDDDWTMRFAGDVGCHPAQVWQAGLMDVLPERIEHGVVAVATGLGRNQWGAAILMRDLTDAMVPPGDSPLTIGRHAAFIDDLAALSARMWGWKDDVGLTPLECRWTWFNHASLAVEESRGWPDPIPLIAHKGWLQFAERVSGPVLDVIESLRRTPDDLVAAVRSTPMTFVHGDWKLGNVGTASDGRTVLIDWTYPGESPCCYELAWYLSINRARLPETKEDTIERFRSRLDHHGVETSGWFDRQMALSLLAATVVFGWEKALGDEDELRWWCDRALDGSALL
jgi:hypothetical protein